MNGSMLQTYGKQNLLLLPHTSEIKVKNDSTNRSSMAPRILPFFHESWRLDQCLYQTLGAFHWVASLFVGTINQYQQLSLEATKARRNPCIPYSQCSQLSGGQCQLISITHRALCTDSPSSSGFVDPHGNIQIGSLLNTTFPQQTLITQYLISFVFPYLRA